MSSSAKHKWEYGHSVIEPQIDAEGKHLFPFDPEFPIDIRYLIFDYRHNIRMNRHDYFELLYSFSSEAKFQVQDREISIKKGDLMVMGSTLFHRPIRSKCRRPKAVVVYFMPDLITEGADGGAGLEYIAPFQMQDSAFPHVIPAKTGIPAQVLHLVGCAYSQFPVTSSEDRLLVKTCVKLMLALLVKNYATYQGTKKAFAHKQQLIKRLQPLLDFIDHNFSKRIRVKDAASMVRMSRSYFSRFFRQVTGQSFVAYLNRTRIAKAQELLVSRDMTIADVSQEVGFCHQGYFGMVFHRLAHLTPLQYKRLAARQLKSGVNSNSAPRPSGDGKVSLPLLGSSRHISRPPFHQWAARRRRSTPRPIPDNSLTLDPGGGRVERKWCSFDQAPTSSSGPSLGGMRGPRSVPGSLPSSFQAIAQASHGPFVRNYGQILIEITRPPDSMKESASVVGFRRLDGDEEAAALMASAAWSPKGILTADRAVIERLSSPSRTNSQR